MQFTELLDEEILIQLPRVHPEILYSVMLRGIEPGGLWIESQEITNAILKSIGASSTQSTPVTFFPYQQISLVLGRAAGPALNEKAFGV